MNWPRSILLSFILFTLFIGALVAVCLRQDISLVSEEYYRDEIAFQRQIVRLENTSMLSRKPIVKIVFHWLMVNFNQDGLVTNCELTLFCPANRKMDRKYEIASSVAFVPLDDLAPGLYRARLSWRMGGREYFQEDLIQI